MPKSVLRHIVIWKTRIAIHIAKHLVSLVLSITAPSSVLLYNSRVMKLASITHCHIFSYSLWPLVAFQGEMIKILLFPFRYFTTIICDCHRPSFLKPKVVVVCLSFCLFCCFTPQVNSYGHCGTVSSPNHIFSWAGLNKRLTSNSCTYFRL